MSFKFFSCLLFVLIAVPAYALDYVLIIGGGPVPDNSQRQIEFNVQWVNKILEELPGQREVLIYFTDGDNPGKDVLLSSAPNKDVDALEPLARVFGQQNKNHQTYRNHEVAKVIDGTAAASLKENLQKDFSKLRQGDRLLIYYSGHGLAAKGDPAGNYLRLWGGTRLTVRELEGLLSSIGPDIPVRFIFPQCFSGAFTRLIYPNADDTQNLAEGIRCGFTSVGQKGSEGCTPSINTNDYLDYTSYFFAALYGKTQTGHLVDGVVDINADGVVSLYEAHIYSFRTALSKDIPRSTSEVYLEKWQPWYLRWATSGKMPNNLYGQIATEIAQAHGMMHAGEIQIDKISKKSRLYKKEMDALERKLDQLNKSIKELQKNIKKDLASLWPEAMHPYTLTYVKFLRNDFEEASNYIVSHPSYSELKQKQDQIEKIEQDFLKLDRQSTQLYKILRFRKLARILGQFERIATKAEEKDYQKLLSCEQQPL